MVANLIGELFGLGLIVVIGYATIYVFGEPDSALYVLSFAALVIGLGAIEGAIVGFAQAIVLRRRLPQLRAWVIATIAGALTAWTLGMLPGTLIGLGDSDSSTTPTEISDSLQIFLAVPLGFVTGTILGFPQWLVLKKYVSRAGWWILANGLAWACGMPIIFLMAGVAQTGDVKWGAVTVVVGLAAAGALVGAIHGAFLVRLLAPMKVVRRVS